MKRKSRLRHLAACAAFAAAAAQAAFVSCSFNTSGSGPPLPPVAPAVKISVAPATITFGQSATLSWSSTAVTTCTASGAWSGPRPGMGTLTVTPANTGTFTYTLNCSTPTGPVAQSATLTVNPAAALEIAPRTVPAGQSALLTWSSSGADSCVATDAWTGRQGTVGTASMAPTQPGSYVFGLTCVDTRGRGNHVMADLTVTNAGFSLTNLVADIDEI